MWPWTVHSSSSQRINLSTRLLNYPSSNGQINPCTLSHFLGLCTALRLLSTHIHWCLFTSAFAQTVPFLWKIFPSPTSAHVQIQSSFKLNPKDSTKPSWILLEISSFLSSFLALYLWWNLTLSISGFSYLGVYLLTRSSISLWASGRHGLLSGSSFNHLSPSSTCSESLLKLSMDTELISYSSCHCGSHLGPESQET